MRNIFWILITFLIVSCHEKQTPMENTVDNQPKIERDTIVAPLKINEPEKQKKDLPIDEYKLDTINFSDIRIYNKIKQKEFNMFTDYENISNFQRSDIVYTGSSKYSEEAIGSDFGFMFNPANIPLFNISKTEEGLFAAYFFETYYEHISYLSYLSEWSEDDVMNWKNNILIHSIEPFGDIIISIETKDRKIIFDKTTTPDIIKQYFPNSYQTYFDCSKQHFIEEIMVFHLKVIYNGNSDYLIIQFEEAGDKNYYFNYALLEKKEVAIYGYGWWKYFE